mgnify:FL=1
MLIKPQAMSSTHEQLIRGIELQQQGRIKDAAQVFQAVLSVEPNHPAALYSLAVIALNGGRPDEALTLTQSGIATSPGFAPLWFAHGSVLQALERKQEAFDAFDAALQLQPDYVEALVNSGVLLRDLLRHHESLERFNRVLTFKPDHVTALTNCAILLTEFKQSEQAIRMFERLLEIRPDYDYGLGLLSYERLHICNWTSYDGLTREIIEGIRAGRRTCKTLALMAICDSAEDHFKAAQIFAASYCPRKPIALWQGERYQHDRIRIAYVSPDFREHPVGHLMAGVFEHHDKSRFETIAISLGIDDQSRLRARMLKAFDHFIDARLMGSRQIAEKMLEMEVDIAIDLAGYTSDSRIEIFAYRPAPVQISYLGYPGTLGTDYIDYIIADRHVIPEDQQKFYSEQVLYLPNSYLPTDSSLQISEQTPTRAECGLPEQGFVFCSFSHDYKISPYMFAIWMRLLAQVPGSVLWLMSRNEAAQMNLRREAVRHGVDPERLVFAQRILHVEDHLARYRLADLFLDTHPYNAHTTAADALMAGLPVVTYLGNAFPSRVAGSLLYSLTLTDLISHSMEEYESIALNLTKNQSKLNQIKAQIRSSRAKKLLFNTEFFCKNLENIYTETYNQSNIVINQLEVQDLAIYCINLDHRKDRWLEALSNYDRYDIPTDIVERFSAVHNDRSGALGCIKSHLLLLAQFIAKKEKNYCLVLEDDFDFEINWKNFSDKVFVKKNILDWDVILLTGTAVISSPTTVPNFFRVFESQSAAGYLVKRSYAPKLLSAFANAVPPFEKSFHLEPRTWSISRFAADVVWKKLQYEDRWFIYAPIFGRQRNSYSDIEKKITNYDDITFKF